MMFVLLAVSCNRYRESSSHSECADTGYVDYEAIILDHQVKVDMQFLHLLGWNLTDNLSCFLVFDHD